MIHIILIDELEQLCCSSSINLLFPTDITFSQMMKAIYFKFDKNERDLILINYSLMNLNNKIQKIFPKEQGIYFSINSGLLGGIFKM